MPEASAPSTKYFIAASVAAIESRCSAIIAYSDRLNSSSPRYSVSKWLADTITIMPSVENSASTKNSPRNMSRARM